MNTLQIFLPKAEKSEKCECIMEKYLSLDKGELLSPKLSAHIIFCKNCRTEIRNLSLAQKLAAKSLKEREDESQKSVSMTQWIVCGILMTIFLIFFGIVSQNRIEELQIGFYIFFAAVLCSYCAVFVAKNLDYFIKKIEKDFGQNLGAV